MRKKISYYDSIPTIDKIGKYRALYEKEIKCPIIEQQKGLKDYEAYKKMHNSDGIIGKPVCARRL